MTDVTTPTAPAAEPRRGRPGGLLFPATLIAVGVLFLAGNLGFIPPLSLRALARLWPVILIVIGIEALLGRRRPWAALALEAGVIGLALVLAASQPLGLLNVAPSGPSEQIVAREGSNKLSLRVSGGAGDYAISGGASALVEARSRSGELRARTTRRNGTAEVRVEDPHDGHQFLFGGPPQGVSVKVASDVPTSLRLDGGAGEFTLDMRDMHVTDARVGIGASRTVVVLPAPRGDVPVRIEAGAATIEIQVPDGVEAKVTTRGAVLSVNSTNPRLAISGGSAETSGYGVAKDRVTVTFDGGAASVTIR